MMDPIRIRARELRRHRPVARADEGTPVDAKAQTFDNTQVMGRRSCEWLTSKYDDLVRRVVGTEKLLTYGSARCRYRDMPLVRAMLGRD